MVLSQQFQKLTFENSGTSQILPNKEAVWSQTRLNMNPLRENRPRSIDLDGSQPAVPKTDFEKSGTSQILLKTRVSSQTALNMNPPEENRPRSIDLDGSQPAVPKTDFEKSGTSQILPLLVGWLLSTLRAGASAQRGLLQSYAAPVTS